MLKLFKKNKDLSFNTKISRLCLVLIPPFLITLIIFFSYFRIYKPANTNIVSTPTSERITEVNYDSVRLKDVLPDVVARNLIFVLCLRNNNVIYQNGEPVDPAQLRAESDMFNGAGAMAVHSSNIPSLDLYVPMGERKCETVDIEKLVPSVITTDIANIVAPTVEVVENKGKIDLYISPRTVNIDKSILYVRMDWGRLMIIFIALFPVWFSLLLLLRSILHFVMGTERIQ